MRRVVKIGGSLLTRPQLPAELEVWLAAQSRAETLLVIGGGGLINAIRQLDSVRPRDSEAVHWQCVDLLQITFAWMHQWFSDWPIVASRDQLQNRIRTGFTIDRPTLVSAEAFYSPTNDYGLPKDWRTTTDTIAGALAIEVAADELVLLKSCELDATQSVSELTSHGIVDEALPRIADRIRQIRVECLPSSTQ